MLNNIKTNKSDKGFTIVELLIVIVVIAILAAITIVAYNGIQNRAKTTSGQSLANSVVKKMEALNAIKGTYLLAANTGAGLNTAANTAPVVNEAKVDVPGSIIAATTSAHNLDATTANGGSVVSIVTCAGGAKIHYWNYENNTAPSVNAGAGC